jgi:hypothetical protein
MTGFVVILAALQLAVPIRCYQTDAAYAMPATHAYYATSGYIALSPDTCRQVRRPTLWGAYILGHELAHLWQDTNGRALNEREADRIGWWAAPGLLRRLVAVTGRAAAVMPSPDTPVRLTP